MLAMTITSLVVCLEVPLIMELKGYISLVIMSERDITQVEQRYIQLKNVLHFKFATDSTLTSSNMLTYSDKVCILVLV